MSAHVLTGDEATREYRGHWRDRVRCPGRVRGGPHVWWGSENTGGRDSESRTPCRYCDAAAITRYRRGSWELVRVELAAAPVMETSNPGRKRPTTTRGSLVGLFT